MKEIFHVHTYRCQHASDEPDEAYVKKAIALGAKKLIFTDHAPFPGDPFLNRMRYTELDEYLNSLQQLREQYQGQIDIQIGLETEYLPSYQDYYQQLRPKLDVLLLGQHLFEMPAGKYSGDAAHCPAFNFEYNLSPSEKAKGIIKAMTQGVKTGLFDVVAHPDRMLPPEYPQDPEFDQLYSELFQACREQDVPIEYNLSSAENSPQSRAFWQKIPADLRVITGYDAHSTKDLDKIN